MRVATTATMVTDLLRVIGGEDVEIIGLMGPGVDPHSYTSRLTDTKILNDADAIFYCGLHLEGTLQGDFEEMAGQGRKVFALTAGIPERLLLAPAEEDFPGHYDPHVWGDPEMWRYCVAEAIKRLSEVDPDNAGSYKKRGAAYMLELEQLNAWAQKRVAEVPGAQRVLVTSHDAFFYFGRAFGFEVRGLQGLSTVVEANLKDRAELVDYIRSSGLKTIFPETSVNQKAIGSVAAEAGCAVSEHHLFSDAMGEAGDMVELHGESYDRGTYIGMVKHNINSIVDGLK